MTVSKKKPTKPDARTGESSSAVAAKKSSVQIKTIKTVARLLEILSVPKEEALTNVELGRKFYGRSGTRQHAFSALTKPELRNIQRYTEALSTKTLDGPALIDVIETGAPNAKRKTRRFYHIRSNVADWLMTGEAALNLLLSQQVLGRAFGSVERISTKKNSEIAARVVSASTETQRLRERIRVVPDGIGRLACHIPQRILRETIEALAKSRKLAFSYIDAKGKESNLLVSPQGVVSKDGTLYLISTRGLSDAVGRPFALHRMKDAQVHHQAAQDRPDFNLDVHIKESHQLSHRLDHDGPPVELKLRVAPESLYHFKERPLSKDQKIGQPRRSDDWRIVTATIPNSWLLAPFLLSMGGWIEVLEPHEVRAELAKRVREMAQHYVADVES